MPKKVFNWTFSETERFLRKHNFTYSHSKGSHRYYIGHYGGQPRIVQVPFHGSKTFKPRTLKGIIKQSGIPQNIWLEN
jgi:predicted RNA binding protein YcfA (HicA-like mRNA interferase family)